MKQGIKRYIQYTYCCHLMAIIVCLVVCVYVSMDVLSQQAAVEQLRLRLHLASAKVPGDQDEIKSLAQWWQLKEKQKVKEIGVAAMLSARSGAHHAMLLQARHVVAPPDAPSHCAYTQLSYQLNFASMLQIVSVLANLDPRYYVVSVDIDHRQDHLILTLLLGNCDVA